MTVVDEPVVAQPEDYVRLGLDPTFRYVLLFGNLRGYKGVGELLAAWLRMSSRALDTRLVIAGRLWGGGRHLLGRMGARLAGTTADATAVQKLLTDARGNSSVVVREGFLRDAEIDALIRISSLAVFPYLRFGGQSGAACRAAACGRPVMVTRVGALGDLAIDDSWVVERGDVVGLAQRLAEKLVARDSLRAACHRQLAIARRCNWSAVAHDHLRVYQELM
jgi:glycosyltransferase involved in cell wall biosynthesis